MAYDADHYNPLNPVYQTTLEPQIVKYKNYEIIEELDPWARKAGMYWTVGIGDAMKSFRYIQEARDYVDELIEAWKEL